MSAVIVVVLALYFLPCLIATLRGHHQTLAIFMVCLFLGWTGIGWIVALIWSCTAVNRPQRAVVMPSIAIPPPTLENSFCRTFGLSTYKAPTPAAIDFSNPPPARPPFKHTEPVDPVEQWLKRKW